MSFLIVRGLDAAGGLEVWKIKAVDILHWSRVLYIAKALTSSARCHRKFSKLIAVVKAQQRTLEYGANETA